MVESTLETVEGTDADLIPLGDLKSIEQQLSDDAAGLHQRLCTIICSNAVIPADGLDVDLTDFDIPEARVVRGDFVYALTTKSEPSRVLASMPIELNQDEETA